MVKQSIQNIITNKKIKKIYWYIYAPAKGAAKGAVHVFAVGGPQDAHVVILHLRGGHKGGQGG